MDKVKSNSLELKVTVVGVTRRSVASLLRLMGSALKCRGVDNGIVRCRGSVGVWEVSKIEDGQEHVFRVAKVVKMATPPSVKVTNLVVKKVRDLEK